MACLVNDVALFESPGGPGGTSIVDRKDFQAKRPLCMDKELIQTYLCAVVAGPAELSTSPLHGR